VAFDHFIPQHAIDPESVEASFLNDDEREDLPVLARVVGVPGRVHDNLCGLRVLLGA
jgi:hypothetical protein